MSETTSIQELRLKSVTPGSIGFKDRLPTPTAAELAGIVRKSGKFRNQTYHEVLQENWHSHILEMGEYTQRKMATNSVTSVSPVTGAMEEIPLVSQREFESKLGQLKRDLLALMSNEIKQLISTLRDEIRNLYQQVEQDRASFEKRQKEIVQHQFDWFRTDLKDDWRKEADKKHEDLCDHVTQATSEQLREFQKYLMHVQESELRMFKTQITSKLERDLKENKTQLQKELNEKVQVLEHSMIRRQKEYESDELNAVKERLDTLQEALMKEKQEKEEIERDFQRLQKEFQKFLENHPSEKFHPDYMLLAKSHMKLSNQPDEDSDSKKPRSRFLSQKKQDTKQ